MRKMVKKIVITLLMALVGANSVFAANVAKIGDTEYATIDAAIAAIANGQQEQGATIKLLSDVSIAGALARVADFTLDGNGKKITCVQAASGDSEWRYLINVSGGSKKKLKNVTLDANGKVPWAVQCIGSTSELYLDNVTIINAKTTTKVKSDGKSATSLGYGIHVNGGKVVANNIKVSNSSICSVYLDGNSSNGTKPSFTLSGDECDFDVVGHSDEVTPSIESSAKGCYSYYVEAKYKFLFISLSKKVTVISSLTWDETINKVGSFAGITVQSATVKLLQDVEFAEPFTSNDTKLTINGNGKKVTGTFKFGANPSPVSNVVLGDGSVLDCTASVKTGFSGVSVAADADIEILLPASADINSYSLPVALGTGAIANITVGDKKYIAKGDTIAPAEMLAQVGDTRYATLQEAIDAANGATVHVLKDVALTAALDVASGKTITLNLAGRKITVSGSDYAIINNGTLTIIDMNLVSVMAAESALDGEEEKSFLITGVSANDGLSALDGAAGGSIAGVQNKGTFALESGSVVAASANVPTIDNAANAVVTITGGTVEGKLQSTDKNALTITGGSFTGESNVAEFVGGNYGVDSDGTVISYVAQLGETKYQTLQEVFAAAKEFDVVTVLDDAADVSDIAGYVAEGLFPISNGDKTYTLRAMPAATVEKLPAFTLTKERDGYACWPSGDETIDRPLDIVMNFLANDDGKAEANESGFADWKCDFYLTFSDMAGDSLVADECYLAGNYGGFGWIVIPADGTKIDNNATLPVVAAYDANITYRQVCETVKKFTAAIHVADAVMEANPDLKITLSLKMTNDKDSSQELVVGSYTYGVDDLKGMYNPEVKVAENVAVDDTFKATVGSALADAYQTAEGNLDVTIVKKGETFATIDVAAKYGYEIPAEGLEMTFPAASVADGETAFVIHKHDGVQYVYSGVVEYGFVTYKNTLGFSEFTVGDAAALNAAIADAEAGDTVMLLSDVELNETLTVAAGKSVTLDLAGFAIESSTTAFEVAGALTLYGGTLIVTDSAKDMFAVTGEGSVTLKHGLFSSDVTEYCAAGLISVKQPNGLYALCPDAKVEVLDPIVLRAGEYGVLTDKWPPSDATEDSYLSVVMKFTAKDTAETIKTSPFKDYATDFYITISGIEGKSFIADENTFIAGSYGEYGWIKIPLTGMEIENGVRYPVLGSAFNGSFPYEFICTSVKEMLCAMTISPKIIDENPNLKVVLDLAVTEDPEVDDEPLNVGGYDYEAEEFLPVVAKVGETTYATLKEALAATGSEDTVKLLSDAVVTEDLSIPAGKNLIIDLAGNKMSAASDTINFNIYGKLEFVDSVGGGVSAMRNHFVYGELGELVLSGGTMRNMETANGGFPVNCDGGKVLLGSGTVESINAGKNYAVNVVNGGEVKINGAEVIGGIRNLGSVTVNRGKVVTQHGDIYHAVYHEGSSLVINGGEFSGNGNEVVHANSAEAIINGGTFTKVGKSSYLLAGSKLVINGGVFNAYAENPAGHPVRADVTIKGGTFNYKPTMVADGYAPVDNGNGTFTVKPYIAQVGDEKFTSLVDAIAAAGDAAGAERVTVEMLGSSGESVKLPENVIIKTNGFAVDSVIDARDDASIVEQVDGLYDVTKVPAVPSIRGMTIIGDIVELRFIPRAALDSVKVLVSSDLKTWEEMNDADIDVVDNGIGKECVITVAKPDGARAFFKLHFEYKTAE